MGAGKGRLDPGRSLRPSRYRAPGCSAVCPQASTPGPACHQVLPPCAVPSSSLLSPVQTPSIVLEATPQAAPGSKQTPLCQLSWSWLLATSPGPNLPRGPSTSPLLSRGKASSKAHRRGLVGVWEGSVLWLHPDCRLCLWEPTPWHHAPAPSTARPEGAGGLLIPLGCQLLGTGTGTHLCSVSILPAEGGSPGSTRWPEAITASIPCPECTRG